MVADVLDEFDERHSCLPVQTAERNRLAELTARLVASVETLLAEAAGHIRQRIS